MKILVVDTYYPGFLADHYRREEIAGQPYAEQRRSLLAACFGTSDFYSRELEKLGVEAEEIVANCAPLQLQWAREQGLRSAWQSAPRRWTLSRLATRLMTGSGTLLSILAEQVRRARPDVLYVQDLNLLPASLLHSLAGSVRLIAGQIASPLPGKEIVAGYHLILTSFPHYLARLRQAGAAAEYLRLGFHPSVLERVGTQQKRFACTFVGGISRDHSRGVTLLERVARNAEVDFFGYGAESLDPESPIRARHHGEVWGLDMYRVLAQSRITLNRHIDVADGYANNMRLYEATGIGAMLLTDSKTNLGELFEVGKEVVAWETPEESVEKICYYAGHPAERDAIARAGQQRTLRDHTYERRMIELVGILKHHLGKR